MTVEICIWTNGDSSVGINGGNHKVTIDIEPAIDFSLMEDGSENDCIKLLEEGAIKMIEGIREFIDTDFRVHICPLRTLKNEGIE